MIRGYRYQAGRVYRMMPSGQEALVTLLGEIADHFDPDAARQLVLKPDDIARELGLLEPEGT